MTDTALSRTAASAAVADLGWRYLLATLAVSVPVSSQAEGIKVATAAVNACGSDSAHLRIDLRPRRVELVLQDGELGKVTTKDVGLATSITAAVADLGLTLAAPTTDPGGDRPIQALELAIDTMDAAAIRPFWKAVLGYDDEPGTPYENSVADPFHQLPTVWFQQLDEPRTQRNRIHFDLTVSHDEAERRIAAALAAGGRMVSDARARAFWILADADGNEICICTWQDRDR